MLSYFLDSFVDFHTYIGLIVGVVFAVPLTALAKKAKTAAAPEVTKIETEVTSEVKTAEADVVAKV
jgi:hypothetical protein